tara:strand:+ start:1499 stop:3112 length:1614 start_codon:yes stop_codon:yes gene_type:complete
MKLNEKTLLFILVVLLILISIYYNKKIVYSNNNKFLLLGIIIALFVFFHKFTNGRIEKFYNDQYENFSDDLLVDYYNKNIELRDALLELMPVPTKTELLIDYYDLNSDWDNFKQDNDNINSLDSNNAIGELQNHHDNVIVMINNILNDPNELDPLETRRTVYLESVLVVVSPENSIETYLINKKDELNGIIQSIIPPSDNIEQYVQDAFNQIDTNNDGKIDFNEFKLFIQSSDEDLTDEDIIDAFNTYDTNNDNLINLQEFNLIMLIGSMSNVLDTEPSSNDNIEQSVQDTETSPTAQYLKRLFLNKSEYHNSSPTINMLNSEQSRTPEIGSETDNDSELRKTQLNFYNFMNGNTNGNTGTTGNNQSIKDILSGDTSVNDLLQYNYADVDDLLKNVSKRNYNFNISPVDFNIPIVNGDPNSTETGSPNPDDTSGNGNNDEDNSEENLNNVVNDITQEPEDETDDNVFSSVTYDRRINEDEENTDDEEDTQENTNTQNNQDRQNIYNTLFGDVQQDEERDGIGYYVNRFFSYLQDLFD